MSRLSRREVYELVGYEPNPEQEECQACAHALQDRGTRTWKCCADHVLCNTGGYCLPVNSRGWCPKFTRRAA